MRHSVYGKKLGRDKNQRTALLKSLVRSLILSEKIQTTEAKARFIKGFVDKIINQAKNPVSRRLVSQFLVQKDASEKLINEILPKVQSRTSGYTSVIKLGFRQGDGAMIVQMSLLLEENAEKKAKKDQVIEDEQPVVKKVTKTKSKKESK